jgi:hypothetical protein
MPKPESTLSVRAGSDLRLGGLVSFNYTISDPHAPIPPSIQILAYDINGSIIFATAGYADRSFLLGGTVSPWLTQGGPAHCVASLYYWKSGKQNILATTEFDALG